MATLVLNTLWKVVQIATGVAGAPYYVTGYFDAQAGTAQAAADAWRNMLAPTSTIHRTGLTWSAITEVGELDPVTGDLVGLTTVNVGSLACIGGTDPLPAASQLLLRWRTGQYVGGKEIRGRTSIPGMTESQSTNGLPDANVTGPYQTRQTAMLALATAKHCVYSPKNHAAARTVTGSPWAQWAILRSRRD